jgi:predicted nucleic acid-binding protein
MANSPRRIYSESSAWIALIQKEQIPDGKGGIEDRYGMCRNVIEAAKKGQIEIVTSFFTQTEVFKPGADSGKLEAFFENDYILRTNVDKFVSEKAQSIMGSRFGKGLKPPDATHLASAIVSNAEEMHTFDTDLLKLDGKIAKTDGTFLKICKPDAGGSPAPLLDAMKAKGDEKTDED